MAAPFTAATAVTPSWMAPPPYQPRHAARDEFPTALDAALRSGLDAVADMFRVSHRVLRAPRRSA